MIYRLISRTFSASGSVELTLVQNIDGFDPALPVKLTVEALVCPPYFRDSEEMIAEFEIEYENREIKSIDGQAVEEIFDRSKQVKITFSYAFPTEGEPILLPADDEVLESEIIE